MGVYIPNATLPDNCWNCKLEQIADCDIHRFLQASDYKEHRYGKCPLIEETENSIMTVPTIIEAR